MKELLTDRNTKLFAKVGSYGYMDIYIRCGTSCPCYLLTRRYDPYLMDMLRKEICLCDFYEKSQKKITAVAKSGPRRWRHGMQECGKKRRVRARKLEDTVQHLFAVVQSFLQYEADYAETA